MSKSALSSLVIFDCRSVLGKSSNLLERLSGRANFKEYCSLVLLSHLYHYQRLSLHSVNEEATDLLGKRFSEKQWLCKGMSSFNAAMLNSASE